MALPVFPPSLRNKFVLGSHNRTPEENFVEFPPDIGPTLRHRRHTAAQMFDTGTVAGLTKAEVETLMNFYEIDCNGGATSFTMADQIDDATETFSWAAPPSAQSRANTVVYDVSMSLIREPS